MTVTRRVIKLGGSVLYGSPWLERFETWLARQEPAESLLLAGGGALAEAIRALDDRLGLDPLLAHRLAIRTMSLHAELLAALWPEARTAASLDGLRGRKPAAGLVVLEPAVICATEEPHWPGEPLPASWDVTSDSIAGRFAAALEPCELVLLKSALPEAGESLSAAAARGYVDRHFPAVLGQRQMVRLVDMGRPECPERVWPSA